MTVLAEVGKCNTTRRLTVTTIPYPTSAAGPRYHYLLCRHHPLAWLHDRLQIRMDAHPYFKQSGLAHACCLAATHYHLCTARNRYARLSETEIRLRDCYGAATDLRQSRQRYEYRSESATATERKRRRVHRMVAIRFSQRFTRGANPVALLNDHFTLTICVPILPKAALPMIPSM